MTVWKEKFIDKNEFARSGDKLLSVKKLVIHYTANNGAGAMNHFNYFNTLEGRYASAHLFVDSKEALLIIPLNEVAYHANDGGKTYVPELKASASYYKEGNANLTSIGVEMCVEKDGTFSKATVSRTEDVFVELCKKFKLDPLKDIVRHYDITHKNCPAPWVKDGSKFTEFKKSVNEKLKASSEKKVADTPKATAKSTNVGVVTILADELNIREKADFDSKIVKVVKKGESYKVYGEENGLYNVGSGFVTTNRKYVGYKSLANPVKEVAPTSKPVAHIEPQQKFGEVEINDGLSFKVIVGSFKDHSEAEKRVEDLKAKKIDSYIISYYEGGKVSFFRVVAGSFDVKENGEKMIENLAKLGFEGFLLAHEY
jgi:N-acetylmuramoyl-L-alanine amidase